MRQLAYALPPCPDSIRSGRRPTPLGRCGKTAPPPKCSFCRSRRKGSCPALAKGAPLRPSDPLAGEARRGDRAHGARGAVRAAVRLSRLTRPAGSTRRYERSPRRPAYAAAPLPRACPPQSSLACSTGSGARSRSRTATAATASCRKPTPTPRCRHRSGAATSSRRPRRRRSRAHGAITLPCPR